MRFFSWVQGVIVGKSGNVGEVSRDNQFRITDRDFFTSHVNTIEANTTLESKRNHYSTGQLFIDDGITLAVQNKGILFIVSA
jgi:hypothetical protein